MKIAFFDAKSYDKLFFDEANASFGMDLKYFDSHLTPDTVLLAQGHPTVCLFVNDFATEEVIDQLHHFGVKLIALRCAGYNNIDLKAASGRIRVVRVPEYSPYAVAEHSLALMLCLNRKLHLAYSRVRENNFSIAGLLGFDMHGKTAGVIGLGKIGRKTVHLLKGLGMEVVGYDPVQGLAENAGCTPVELEELYRRADIISLHCPLTHENRHLIDKKALATMKEGVMLINTGRGALIDTAALIDALKKKKVGAAGLDVYEEESHYFYEDLSATFIPDDELARLQTFPNVLITSHQGFFTREALRNIARTTLENIHSFEKNLPLENEVCFA